MPTLEAHSMSPAVVFDMLAGLGGKVDRILIVGCEPATVEEGIGLSEVVAASVDLRRRRRRRRARRVVSISVPDGAVSMRGEANP